MSDSAEWAQSAKHSVQASLTPELLSSLQCCRWTPTCGAPQRFGRDAKSLNWLPRFIVWDKLLPRLRLL